MKEVMKKYAIQRDARVTVTRLRRSYATLPILANTLAKFPSKHVLG